MDATKILVLLSIVAAAFAGPITLQESDTCSTQCTENSKIKYNPGTTYVYDYRVDTDSSLAGAFEDSAKTTLQTSVNIEVLSPCEFALELRNTKLFHTNGNGAMKTADRENAIRREVEASPLRFSYQNGVVEHVCPDDESVRSLNFKKGILSAFQNSMDDLTHSENVTETDVVGTCKAEYKVQSNGYYTTQVKKVKDILSCTDRLDYMTMLQLTSYNIPSDMQNMPIMKTSHACEQAIENGGVLKSSVCKESHVYRPFANGQNGARVTITQSLTFDTYSIGTSIRTGQVKTRSSLLFDHSANHPNVRQSRVVVEQKLSEICDSTTNDVRPETPRLFTDLVAAMKGLDKQNLGNLHQLLKTKTICPTNPKAYKFFHDALPMVSTSGSVRLMTELINSKDVSGMEVTAWLTSLAFIQYPTADMLVDVQSLIDNKNVRKEAMLPVSSMINNFCKKMGTCDQDRTVINLMSSLESNIDYYCDASGDKFELTLLTLKAIGNAGHAIRAVPVLNKCMTSTSNPLEIRVAAAEAFRRMPCVADHTNLWHTFSDKDLDSELRINAFLALMRCPTQENLGKIAAILNSEEDEQVGAFVYSHLTNLRETSDPHKQTVADSVNNLVLEKEFDLSPLKYSRNFEVSALINKINTGVTAESNLIWSNKVQLPRAVSGNLTIQLFGQSVNLLDFGGRLEGLEYLIKSIFGPYMNYNEEKKPRLDDVKGSFYGRLFGNEMLFMHSQTTKSLFGEKPPTYLDILIKLANKQHVALTQSVQFMDVCMTIPSMAGLPIHVKVNGMATIDLSMSGKMDLRKVGASPRSMDVDGEIRPSAALEITGAMIVDSFGTNTGLRMRNTLHTSTAVKGRIQMTRGQQLNVELDTPEDKMEIVDARSKFFVIHNDIEQEQEMIKENRKEFKLCSGKDMTEITGMEVCGEISFPNASMKADSPYFPLTGPTSVSITAFKRDSHSGYKLFAKRVENKKASIAQISFKTPGSRVNRAISVDMTLNYKKKDIEMNMATPWKKLAVNGNLINLKDLKSLKGSVVIDDKDTYAMTGEVKVSKSKNKIQFNPMFELRRPGADNIQVTGFIDMENPLKSVNMEMSLSGINKLPYTLKSALTNNKKEKSIQTSFSFDGKKEYKFEAKNVITLAGKKSAQIRSILEVESPDRKLVKISGSGDHRVDKSLKFDTSFYMYRVVKKPATFKVNLMKTSRRKANNYKAIVNLKSSAVSGNIVCNLARKGRGFTSLTSKIDYTIPRVAKNIINFSGKLNDRSTKAYKSYVVQSNFGVVKNPEYNSNIKLEVGHKKKHSVISVEGKYGANPKDATKTFYFLTSLTKKSATLKNALINYKVKAQAPALNVDLMLQGKHQHNPKLIDSDIQLSYAPKKDISASINLKNRSTKLMNMIGKAIVSWPGQEYSMNTELAQKTPKQYNHELTLRSRSGIKHTISTEYKMSKSDAHDVVANFRLHKIEPVTISGSTNLNMKNFAASGEVKTGEDVYGFNALSKISKAPSAKMSLELIHPSRRVTLAVNGGRSRGKYEGKIETAWDANNDKTQKMSIEGECFHKTARGSISMGGNVNFLSPFAKFENLFGSFKYTLDKSKHVVNSKFMWGNKSDQIMSTVTVKKPISLNNFQLNGNIKTPFKGIRSGEIDISHKMESDISTVITGDLEKETAKLSFQGQKINNGYKGSMHLKSTIKNAESVALSASHTGTDGKYDSNAELNHNGKVYAYDLVMSHSRDGPKRACSGDLVLTWNNQKLSNRWDHEHKAFDSVKTFISSNWNKNLLIIDLTGSHELADLRNINGVLKIKSPWKPIRDVEFNIDHKHGSGLIDSITFLRQGKSKKASSAINYKSGQNSHDFDFMIVSPFHEDKSGKFSTNYDSYPMTSSAELQWAPKMKGSMEGSLNLASWNNADLNMKMTTPSRTMRNVVLKASNKKQNGEIVSNVNLNYGMRQNIDLESRILNENKNKMLRLKMNSPFKQVKSLNTGLNFNGNAYKFDTTADFELLPIVGKFDGAMNWQYDNDVSGKIRLDTPFPEYPYFELSTSSNVDGASRKSHIQAEYHPRQVFSLDTSHSSGSPLSFDATLRSPYPQFDNVGVSFQHNMADSSVKSHGEVKYQSDKKIEADLDADWSSGMEGNFLIKTPFRGYESNKISMRHRGNLDNFDTHGEINVAEQNIAADASFKSGYTTTGTFTFSSPVPGFESIDVSLRKKGNLKNFKLGANINVNGDRIQSTLNNKMMKDSIKTNFNFMTPYTETFKFALDHSGRLDSFTNKVDVNYGRKVDIDTIASLDIRDNDVNGNGILKYKFGKGRNTARVSFTRNGPIEDVSFSTTASFNRDDITASGSLRTKNGIEGSVYVKTPFDNFKNTGMTIFHSGDLTNFISNANINYMDNKNIMGKVEFSNENGIKLSSELTTPFKNFKSTSVKVSHDTNNYSGDISGNAELTTTIGGFGTGDVSYSKTGDLTDLVLKGSVSSNGKDMAVLKLTNNMQNSEVHSMCSLTSAATPDMYFSIDHSGDRFSFNTKTMGKVGKNTVSTDANMKRSYDSVSADGSITYKLQGQRKNTASVTLQKDGPLDNCNMDLTGKFNNDEIKLSASRSGALNNMRFSGSASYNRKSIDVSGGWKNTENIEATLKVLTPFENFNKVGLAISHSGDLSDLTTSFNVNYMDGKDINGKVELQAYTFNNVKFMSELITPFENFETLHMKFNNKYNTYTSDLNGEAAIDTSIAGFGTGSIVYSKTGSLDNLDVTGNVLRNGVEVADLKIKNTLLDQEMHSSFEYKSTVTPLVVLTLDHNGDLTDLKTSVKATVGKRNIITGEATLNQRSKTVDAEGKFIYTIEDFGTNDLSLTMHKEGQINDFNFEITGKNGAKTSKIIGNFKNEDELFGELTVNTPIEGYKNVGLSFKHSRSIDSFISNGKIVLTDGEEFSGKIDFYRHLLRQINVVVELNTPITDLEFTKFEFRHEGESDGFKCSSVLQFGNSQRITYDLTATASPKPEITVTLNLPHEKLMASGSYENTWPKYAVNGKIEAGEGRSISLDGSLDASDDIVGELTLSTPIEDFSSVGLSFKHMPKSSGINSEGRITYMDGQVIYGKAEATMSKTGSDLSLELTTPFAGYEFTKLETKHVLNKRVIKTINKLIYANNKKITVDAYSKFKPSPEFSLTITSPFSKDIEALVSLDNTWPKYELACKMTPGNGDRFTLDGTFDATNDISGSLKIGTPFKNFNKVGMSFMHSGDSDKFGTEGTVNYMDGQEIFGKVNFYRYMWRRIDASLELNTPFNGMENTKAEVNYEDNSNSISTTAALEYNNGEKVNGNVKVTYSPSYDVVVTLNTPVDVIKAQGALDMTSPNYEAMCSLNYGSNVYSANGKFNFYSADHLDGSLEVNTPLSGFEYTKAEYQHKLESSELEGSISLIYDDGKRMSCDVKSTLSPNFDGTVTVKTPFMGLENMQGSATFERSYKRYETSSSLNLGNGRVFSMTSELDYSIEPMKASTKISTPFKNYRNVELDLTHEGGLTNFKTTGFLSSPLTDHVNAKASLRYDAVMDMSAAASLQSSIEGFDDLRAEVKTSDIAGEMKTNALLGWTSRQQITFDSTFRKQGSWNEDKAFVDVGISTPFVAVHTMNLHMDQTVGTNSYAKKVNFELSGDSLLDYDVELDFNNKKTGEVIVRQPWPMQYTASLTRNDELIDAEVFANWNRDEQDSNVRVQASITDKSNRNQMNNGLDLSMTYASRKFGLVNHFSKDPSQTLGNGYVYWDSDDESKVSYDVKVNENSRRGKQIVDGSFKLGLPTRTLSLTGSCSENSAMVSTDTTFSWDADRDDSKQVGVKTNVRLGDNLKGDITLSMPSLRKEIRVDGEVMMNNGRVILDTKTDISYSRDSRKTLTLTSKLEDISTRNSHFNYSLALGLKHAFTNVDIAMNSHIGSSDESMTLGVSANYLTSKRQMKNLALLSEINMLKKQISVQVFSPENSMEIVGDIVSETPYKMRLINKINGQESFRSDVTVDKTKKAFTFNTFTESDILTFAAKYPNNSAFRVDFTRHTPDYDQQEALMAVRLNTSRLLHTRLSWRPDMMQDANAYVEQRLTELSESAMEGFGSFNEEFAEELSSKYSAITNEMSRELQPFVSALNDELALVAEKMIELSDKLRKMYDNNDLYIQNMGEGVLKLQARMERLAQEYTTTYTQLIASLRENLYEMRRFQAGAQYKYFIKQTSAWLLSESVSSFASLELYMAEVDQVLKEYKESVVAMKQKAMDTVYNGTYVDYLSKKIGQVGDVDISPYISSFNLPEQYTNVIYDIPSKVNAKLNDMLDKSDVTFVKEGLNEVYQQAAWAYNYWQLEENLEKHASSILQTLKEIVEDEIKQYSEELLSLFSNPITVWDPEHGEVQAEIPLPIVVKRLDQVPDMKPLISEVENFVDTYLPDENTWGNVVESVSDMWPANKTNDDLVVALKQLKPRRRHRKGGRRVKKSRQ